LGIFESVWLDEKQKEQLSILRDLLINIFKRNNGIVFKGGTALAFFYGSERFSEDLDLSVDSEEAYLRIDNAIEDISAKGKYEIVNDWENEIENDRGFRRYLLRFKYGLEESINIHIDCSIEEVVLEPEQVMLSNGYDVAKILVMKKEEMLTEKVRAIYTRHKGRDLYDLYFLAVILKTVISISLIHEKFKRYGVAERFSSESFSRRIEELRPYWNDLKGIVNNFEALDFGSVKNSVVEAFKNI